MIRTLFAAVMSLVVAGVPLVACGDDYPQWMGPRRDGIYREEGVLAAFPAGGPKVLWRAPVGGGYAGVAVAGGKVFVTDFQRKPGTPQPKNPFDRAALAGTERVLCLDDATGRVLWAHAYDVDYTVSYAAGPRCTPAVDVAAGKVYTLGAEGHLHCLDANTGKVEWHRKLEGPTPVWGFAGHPLIDGDRLIVLTSGKDALVTAFDKRTGAVAWGSMRAVQPGYAPPMIYPIEGKRRLIQWYPAGVAALDPETGAVAWDVKHGPIRNGVSIVPPLLADDRLLISSFEEGLLALRATADAVPEKLYHVNRRTRDTKTLHALMNPIARGDGLVYAASGNGEFRAVDPATGRLAWETTRPTIGEGDPRAWYTAFVTPWQPDGDAQPRHYFIANEDGDLIVARLDRQGYAELARAHLIDPANRDANRPVVWSHPAYANQSVYWRNDKELVRASLAADDAAGK